MTAPNQHFLETATLRGRAAMRTLFAVAVALAVCVVLLFWTPLEAPASWRAANQTASGAVGE